jgi:hypothetical protein
LLFNQVREFQKHCGNDSDEDQRNEQERELVPVVVAERDHPRDDAERHAEEPRRDKAPPCGRDGEPRDEERQRVGRIAAERDVVVMGELADRREREDRDGAAEKQCSQKNLRAPR